VSLGALTAFLLQGCASRPVNEPISAIDLAHGYRSTVALENRKKNDQETLLMLAFSGGGTRAAAFSYGVLEELRRTPIVIKGRQERLIDEIDVMTGVSGGSFTALAYALYGDELFQFYETRFLKRNVQQALVERAFNPFNWPRLAGGSYGRSELAADYYDEILFDGATFGDLIGKQTPIAIVTGTDLTTGSRLAFTQGDFDLLCSDLNKVRLARAAATSSAVPTVLSPVTFNNYGGSCHYSYPVWVDDVVKPNPSRPAGRALRRYSEMADFRQGTTRPYIHLVDGGVSDNLGVRSILELLEEIESSRQLRARADIRPIRRIAVIVVNARDSPRTDWDQKESAPNFVAQLLRASGVPIDKYSWESVEVMKDIVARWSMEHELAVAQVRLAGESAAYAEAVVPRIELFAIDVSFDQIASAEDRRYFEDLPTSFYLPPSEVDRLREIAGVLLRASPAYQRLVKELGGELH
jgi:NTE family protein